MMLPESKKHACDRLPPDLLSDLPENVINDILMRFPLREAVKTSILSKKWKYKWCRLPQLKLDDDNLWRPTDHLLSPSIKFTNIMYHILTLHSGPLTKFTLSMSELKKYPKPKIDSLIYFLSRNDIEHLVLKFSRWNQYALPSSLFACTKLRHLALQNCVVCHPLSFEGFDMLVSLELCDVTITAELQDLPSSFFACTKLRHFALRNSVICPTPSFKGFDMLISLELCDVTLSSELLESLISYSPLLEKLVLRILETFDHIIQIKASNLRSFEFEGCIKCISLENVPLLAKVSLFYRPCFGKSEKCVLDNFFRSLPALEHLYLDYGTVQNLIAGAAEVPRRLSSPLNYLKRLNVSLDKLADLFCAVCLIRSSPYLRDLELKVCRIGYDKSKTYEPLTTNVVDEVVARFSDVTLNYLRTVQLERVEGTTLEMQLIELLLTKSPILVKMLVVPNSGLCSYDETRNKILAGLTQIQRASCKVEVVVFDEYEEYRDM